jgi:hypothetical protein
MLHKETMKRGVILIALGTFLSGFACLDRFSGDWGTTVKGVVTDSVTGVPLVGAKITVSDTLGYSPTVSDSAGKFVFGDFGGKFLVYCQMSGYNTKSRAISTQKRNSTIDNVNFELAPLVN